MPDVMSIAVTALQADQLRLDLISRNVANASTAGYRRGVAAAIDFDGVMTAQHALTPSARAMGVSLVGPSMQRGVDPTQAGLTMTGRSLDLAVDGAGYFVVSKNNAISLTRSGAYAIDHDGWLVNGVGARLQGRQGDIKVDLGQPVEVDVKGQVLVAGKVVDRLRLLDAAKGAVLTSADGMSLTSSTGEYVEVVDGHSSVRAGFLEASNVTGVRESVGMLEVARHFESIVRLMQGYDEVLGRAIQKLGE